VTGTDDADLPGGRDMVANHVVPDGTGVWWAYAVTNTGNVTLTDVQVVDDHVGVVCSGVTLAAGATGWCVLPGCGEPGRPPTAGQYGNTGTATGVDTVSNPSAPVTVGPVSDPTHVFVPTPAISLKKYTNDQDADTPDTRPQIDAGAGVVWRYVVTNTGDWPLDRGQPRRRRRGCDQLSGAAGLAEPAAAGPVGHLHRDRRRRPHSPAAPTT
jgi:hypothetical protein